MGYQRFSGLFNYYNYLFVWRVNSGHQSHLFSLAVFSFPSFFFSFFFSSAESRTQDLIHAKQIRLDIFDLSICYIFIILIFFIKYIIIFFPVLPGSPTLPLIKHVNHSKCDSIFLPKKVWTVVVLLSAHKCLGIQVLPWEQLRGGHSS